MAFALVFDTDSAAFDDPLHEDPEAHDRPEAVASVLQAVLEAVEEGRTEGPVYDINGVRVGRWSYGPDRHFELVTVPHPAGRDR